MLTIQGVKEQSLNKKKAQELHSQYMALALDVRKQHGTRALFEHYYQCAEHYLHLMNQLKDSVPITPAQVKKLTQQRAIRPLTPRGTLWPQNPRGHQYKKAG